MPLTLPAFPRLRGPDLLLTLGLAVLYAAAAKLGLALALQADQVSAVWPPTGLALAAVLRFGRRAVPGVLIGAFAANASVGEPLLVAAGIGLGNTLEAVAGATLLRLLRFDGRLERVRDVLSLLATAAASPVISASIGVACLVAGGVQPPSSFVGLWGLWWLGDALGALIVAPALLVWTEKNVLSRRRRTLLEGAALLTALFGAGAVAFSEVPGAQLSEYVAFPFIIWAALRFGPAGSVTVAVVIYVFEAWATYLGVGPFTDVGPERALILLQVFMAIVSVTGLLLAAITAQMRAARTNAQLSERRLLLGLQAARAGAWDWDLITGATYRSPGLETVLGFPPGGFGNTPDAFRALLDPEDRERLDAAMRAATADNRSSYNAEIRIRRPDGTIAWVDTRGEVLRDPAGKPARMVGVAIDVTRQKELEAELRRQAEQLAEADRRKTEFLAMLSHELRNPLAPIVHAVDLLRSDDPKIAAQAQEIIRRQSAHLARLVDDLLDVSRISRGAIHLERRRTTVAELVTTAVEGWRHFIAQRKQELTIQLPDRPLWLEVDPTRFAQVIANLLHNSAKFTPNAGKIFIRAEESGGWLRLSIRDTGAGISPKVLSHVFEVFVQGAPPIDRPQGGLGLGLALVRRLVELHGGTVEALSEGPGRGSEFVVRIPVADAAAPKSASADAAATGMLRSARGRRILIVEDNADARETLCLLLEGDGHEVRAVGDGARGLAEARAFVPEIALLDLGLPGLDGYSVAKELRSLEQCSGMLLVAISGYGQPQDRAKSKAAGFDEHLVKPVDPQRLREFLGQWGRSPAR